MYLLYSLLLTLGFVVLLPRFLFDAFRHGKYIAGFKERLGFLTALPIKGPVLWLHCVSVGETQAARPLFELIQRKYPAYSLVVSTTTLTGQNLAQQLFRAKAARVFYFPLDWRWSVRRTLRAIKPSLVLLMETELWPNFLRECAAQKIPVALVNGRISDKSVRRYRAVRRFLKQVVGDLRLAVMQAQADADRLVDLGFSKKLILVSGSLKFDAGTTVAASPLTETFRKRFALQPSDGLILAASTHAPEERILLESFRSVKQKCGARLMLAPRHPERFNEVASLLKASDFSWTKRSATEQTSDERCDVILLDTIGELTAVYPLASIVFVGGSISNTGGHNILEPAAIGKCIITGAHTQNFRVIVEEFRKVDALVQLPPLDDHEMPAELSQLLETFIANPEKCEEIGNRAARLVEQNQGATERTLEFLEPLLANNKPKEQQRAFVGQD